MAQETECEELLREIERRLRGIRMQTSGVPTNPVAAMDLHYTINNGLRFLDPACEDCRKLMEDLERRLRRIQFQLGHDRVETIDGAIASINARLSQ